MGMPRIIESVQQEEKEALKPNQEEHLLLDHPESFFQQYGQYFKTCTISSGMVGGGAGLALSILMLVKPELFVSWNATLAMYTYLLAPAEGATIGSAAGFFTSISVFGFHHLFCHAKHERQENIIDEEIGHIPLLQGL